MTTLPFLPSGFTGAAIWMKQMLPFNSVDNSKLHAICNSFAEEHRLPPKNHQTIRRTRRQMIAYKALRAMTWRRVVRFVGYFRDLLAPG
jgi:hypothetical protein